ncbi:MAG TPA: CPBP family intramembrane metalloprotease, partial [Thermoprotei archaeon]|nr:CPBP family intramembrane metalloprotease [Thermoprotei archaeon]
LLHQNLADYGFKSANRKILLSIPISLIFSFPLAIVSMYLSENYTPPIALEDIRIMLLLAIVVSPIGEEVLFRGFIEGYLLKHTDRWIAIAMPALLFSAMHIVPYISAPLPALLLTLLGAFILGMLAGYYRAVYGSLIPAVIVHSVFNLSGIVVWLCL